MQRPIESRTIARRAPRLALLAALSALFAVSATAQPPRPTAQAIDLSGLTAERFARLADEQLVVVGEETTTAGELRAAAESARDRMRRMTRRAGRSAARHLDYRRRLLERDQERLRESTIEELRARSAPVTRPRPVATDPDGGG